MRPGPTFTSVPVIFSSKLYHHFEAQSTIFGQMYTGSFFQSGEDGQILICRAVSDGPKSLPQAAKLPVQGKVARREAP